MKTKSHSDHKHSTKPEFSLVIGDKTLSSWSLRAWLCAVQTGAPFKEICIALDTPKTSAQIKKHSPSGKVPVLIHGQNTVWDTLAIAEYLYELYPESGLWPKDPKARAMARSYTAEMHSGFMSLRSQCSMDLSLRIQIKHLTSGTVADIQRLLNMWTAALKKSKGPYLFGDFCIADAFFTPVVFRFISYGIQISDKTVLQYMQNIQEHHGVQFWVEEAKKEKLYRQKF